jgi:poly(hydroxyalkanoate) depolymerase family esterase
MKSDLMAEILRATGSLRSGDPAGTTAIIQAALRAGGLAPDGAAASWQPLSEPLGRHASPNGDPDRPEGREKAGQVARGARLKRPLGEVVRTLAAGRRRLGLESGTPPLRAPDLPMPQGAQFHDLHFVCSAGARRYRLYVPASAGDGIDGLIVMLHGCTQSPEDFAAGTEMNRLAERHRLLVAYPAQTGGDNTMSCWNWFRPEDQRRGVGEPAIIAGMAQAVRDQYAVPRDRVFVAGLSAGGAMAAILGEAYPDVFAAVGVHSGLARGSANDVMSAFAAMRGQTVVAGPPGGGEAEFGTQPRLIVFHGDADATVHPSNARRIVASRRGRPDATRHSVHPGEAGGHGYARMVAERQDGTPELECWIVEGAGHAWMGGHASGSYTDARGPNASEEMVRFFLAARS